MTFQIYQNTASMTCLPHCFCPAYLRSGLLGEAGEICDKIKRLTRGDLRIENDAHLIAAEIGDVLWYAAMWAKYKKVDVTKVSLNTHIFFPLCLSSVPRLEEFAADVMESAFIFRMAASRTQLQTLLRRLEILANAIGYTLSHIAYINTEKLQGRLVNGKIQGAGDAR